MALDLNTSERFHDLFYNVKKEIKSDRYFQSEYYRKVEKAVEFLESEVPKLKVQKKKQTIATLQERHQQRKETSTLHFFFRYEMKPHKSAAVEITPDFCGYR